MVTKSIDMAVILLYYVKSTTEEQLLIGVFKDKAAAQRRINYLCDKSPDIWIPMRFTMVEEDVKE